ncbi:MAG: hypothetical protein ICV77_02725 [Cyanobacteria bacterium Co-bin8]|nr:hypothetical protein [Cyanobacteria bacterium Co-bin8]
MLILLLLGQPFQGVGQATMLPAETVFWQCEATGAGHSYRAVLDPAASVYELSFYGDSQYSNLVETFQVNREPGEGVAISASGQADDGRNIRLKALDPGLTFHVEDSTFGQSVGRCIRDTGFN